MELIVMPLPIICKTSIIIKKLTIAIHCVIFPLSLVVSSIFVVKGPFAVSLIVMYESAVLTSVLVLQLSVLAFGLVWGNLTDWLLFCGIFFRDSSVILKLNSGIIVSDGSFRRFFNYLHFLIDVILLNIIIRNWVFYDTLCNWLSQA